MNTGFSSPRRKTIVNSQSQIVNKGKDPVQKEIVFLFSLLDRQTASIIELSGYDSSEAATLCIVLSCFMPRGLGCYTETI